MTRRDHSDVSNQVSHDTFFFFGNPFLKITLVANATLHDSPVVCQLCHWEGCAGNESSCWRRGTLIWGFGNPTIYFVVVIIKSAFFFFLSWCDHSCIWSSWTSLRGTLSLKELMIPAASSSHLILHGLSSVSFPESFSTVYLQRHWISSTAKKLLTEQQMPLSGLIWDLFLQDAMKKIRWVFIDSDIRI